MQTVGDAQSLVTTRNDIVAGFRWQAEEKARRANEFHAIALHFCVSAGRIQSVANIIGDARLYQFALGACALSAKGARQLGSDVCRQIIEATIDLQRLTDAAYVAELERRYLLTCGDALGGSMRNAIGQRAQNKLSDFVCNYLAEGQIQANIKRNAGGKITEISWRNRTLAFDRKPRFINKNIDFILMDTPRFAAATLEQSQRLIAFGELKGGIDPCRCGRTLENGQSRTGSCASGICRQAISGTEPVFRRGRHRAVNGGGDFRPAYKQCSHRCGKPPSSRAVGGINANPH